MRLSEPKDGQKCRKPSFPDGAYIQRIGTKFFWDHGGHVQLDTWCLDDDFELIADDPAARYADLNWRREALTDNTREALRSAFTAGREYERANRPKIDVHAALNAFSTECGLHLQELLERINNGEFLQP